MRALDSAIAFSKETGRSICVIWTLGQDLNCRFEDLFLVPKRFKMLIQIADEKNFEVFSRRCIRKLFSVSGRLLDCAKVGERFGDIFRSRFAKQKGLVYVETFYRLPYGSRHFADFHPAEPMQRKIDHYVRNFENVVGVHIRRTDNNKSIQYSPTSSFIECMQREVDEDNKVKFFLATDSLQVEDEIRKIFPTRIITHAKSSLDRNNPLAIQDALIDLYCLSMTRKLIGSYWSSFTDTASEIGQMETLIARKAAGPDSAI